MKRLAASSLATLLLICGSAHADCSRLENSTPNPSVAPGTPDSSIPIEHVIVIMQENHSFDNYFGGLNKPEYYGRSIDGFTPFMSQPDANGRPVFFHHNESLCVSDTNHQWDAIHQSWDGGKNDRWVIVNGEKVMDYYDERDLPFYYGLASTFATADRYFSSILGGTDANRFYLYAGTSFGHIANDSPSSGTQFAQRTIFDVLSEHGVRWKYYKSLFGNYLNAFRPMYHKAKREGHIAAVSDFARDLKKGRLPAVSFLEASELFLDEHPSSDVQLGQAWVAARVRALMKSRYWQRSVLFLTYDEGGGDYDHVLPPPACVPDAIPPLLNPGDESGGFDRYGVRVPFIAVSPWAKRHYVSHVTYDHTSILKFIETKFNLPALSRRDANANDLLDLFDFEREGPRVSRLPKAKVDWGKALACLFEHGNH